MSVRLFHENAPEDTSNRQWRAWVCDYSVQQAASAHISQSSHVQNPEGWVIKTQYIFVMMEETTSKDKKQCIMYFLCQAVNKVFIASKLAILL